MTHTDFFSSSHFPMSLCICIYCGGGGGVFLHYKPGIIQCKDFLLGGIITYFNSILSLLICFYFSSQHLSPSDIIILLIYFLSSLEYSFNRTEFHNENHTYNSTLHVLVTHAMCIHSCKSHMNVYSFSPGLLNE